MPRYIKLKKKPHLQNLYLGPKIKGKLKRKLYSYTAFEERLGGPTESSLQFRVFFSFCVVLLCRFFFCLGS